MKELGIAFSILLTLTLSSFATVPIITPAKTFQKDGGAASIVVSCNGTWTATSDRIVKQESGEE